MGKQMYSGGNEVAPVRIMVPEQCRFWCSGRHAAAMHALSLNCVEIDGVTKKARAYVRKCHAVEERLACSMAELRTWMV